MSGDWTPEVARTRAWREAPYRFAPLRHALTAGVLLAGGVAVELVELLAVGNGVRAARRPAHDPA